MEEIQFSDLEKNLNGIIKSVCNSDKSVLIADQGKFLVKITPVFSPVEDSWLGCMGAKGKIVGDIISPAEDSNVWEALAQ
uniref:Antitoxin component of toxin-antitoxin stability system, DNA-binding transcriptional repressor n=1 Tax=Candidatus Kentrum sp. FW TaxID=2126338 RepID=A0A450TQX0_9GAMM|nr:MAG: hypothetical protein BECKFW1821C_GA0114237_102318 [Candidatus Kentron sp. FW]